MNDALDFLRAIKARRRKVDIQICPWSITLFETNFQIPVGLPCLAQEN